MAQPHGRNPQVLKSSGEVQPFSEQKLHDSLRRSGAPEEMVRRVMQRIRGRLSAQVESRQLYRWAYAALRREARTAAARYSLKQAMMQLGPSGYPFEKLVAGLLAAEGYRVRTDVILPGHCVDHEVDVVAEGPKGRILVECKYRNQRGGVCDVKVALYVQARAVDLRSRGGGAERDAFWLVTNARFTQDALRYGRCVGLELLGWDYPAQRGLEAWIQETGVYPVTVLTSLRTHQKEALLRRGVVLCSELTEAVLSELRLPASVVEKVLVEVAELTRFVDVQRWAEREASGL